MSVNPYGTASATVNWDQFGSGWYDTLPAVYGSKQGFWDIGMGSITLQVPNNPSAGAAFSKDIQLQVTYWRDLAQAPTVTVSPFATQVGATITALVLDPPGLGAWYSDLYYFRLSTSPTSESITLFGKAGAGSMIDQIVLDTVSVPEPSALASGVVLALSAFIASRRRRA